MTESPEGLSVRPYRAADRGQLEALWARVFPDDPPRSTAGAGLRPNWCSQRSTVFAGSAVRRSTYRSVRVTLRLSLSTRDWATRSRSA
jgi:hypothetical protein